MRCFPDRRYERGRMDSPALEHAAAKAGADFRRCMGTRIWRPGMARHQRKPFSAVVFSGVHAGAAVWIWCKDASECNVLLAGRYKRHYACTGRTVRRRGCPAKRQALKSCGTGMYGKGGNGFVWLCAGILPDDVPRPGFPGCSGIWQQ